MPDPDGGFAARHAVLARGYIGRPDPDDPALVEAMQIVLHIPKVDPPLRSSVLAAAAAATLTLCLDDRVGPDGPWHRSYLSWATSRFRKVARRARGAQWQAAQEVPGITVELGGAQARALVPGPVGELDPRIKRLQVGGTDLVHDDPGPPHAARPVFWVQAALDMTVGKAAAQVGHAAMLLAGTMPAGDVFAWAQSGFACSVRDAGADVWQRVTQRVDAAAVRDAGFTEVMPGSMTVVGVPQP